MTEEKSEISTKCRQLKLKSTDVEVALANLGEIATKEFAKEHKSFTKNKF